jgi:hypothetical protein
LATKSTTMARPEAHIGGKFALMSPPDIGGIPSSVVPGSLQCQLLETSYMPGPKPMTFMYEGSARPR